MAKFAIVFLLGALIAAVFADTTPEEPLWKESAEELIDHTTEAEAKLRGSRSAGVPKFLLSKLKEGLAGGHGNGNSAKSAGTYNVVQILEPTNQVLGGQSSGCAGVSGYPEHLAGLGGLAGPEGCPGLECLGCCKKCCELEKDIGFGENLNCGQEVGFRGIDLTAGNIRNIGKIVYDQLKRCLEFLKKDPAHLLKLLKVKNDLETFFSKRMIL